VKGKLSKGTLPSRRRKGFERKKQRRINLHSGGNGSIGVELPGPLREGCRLGLEK